MKLSTHKPDLNWAMDASEFIPAGVEENVNGVNQYTHECIECGFNVWNLMVTFTDYEISGYFTEMSCASCGTLMRAPCLIDMPGYVAPEL